MASIDKPTRKLAAIMFTDIAGFTRSMSKSESATLELLEKKRSIIKSLLPRHGGTFVKEIGDGTLSYFESAIDAATCAMEFQEKTYKTDMDIRIGIHIGDIVFKGEDVYGDGVNIAARLESIAPAGGVCVSKSVYDELLNKEGFDGIELGLQSLKGVGRLVEVFGLKGGKLSEPDPSKYNKNKVKIHSGDEVPSIAIIPFDNKGDQEDVFYAYGISSDLISVCSGAGLIRVASLKDVEKLDYNGMENIELSEKLLVRYIAQGTLWKVEEMFQLSIELYDTKESKVVWSDRWQEKWEDLPEIMGSLSDGLLKALDTKSKVGILVETDNTEAYEYYLKGKYRYEKRQSMEDTKIARGLLKKAIEIDGNLLQAKNTFAATYLSIGQWDQAMKILRETLKKGEEIKNKNIISHTLGNIALIYINKGNYDKALGYFNRSLKISMEMNDNLSIGRGIAAIGNIYHSKGAHENALKNYRRSLKMFNKIGYKRGVANLLANIGLIFNIKGDKEAALKNFNSSLEIREEIHEKENMGQTINNIGGIYFLDGDYEKALAYFTRSLSIAEELESPEQIGTSLVNIGNIYSSKGDHEQALDYSYNAIKILEKINYLKGVAYGLKQIGVIYYFKNSYEKAEEYLERFLTINKEIRFITNDLVEAQVYYSLAHKQLGKPFDVNKIYKHIKDNKNIKFEINLRLYELLEDSTYLETSYKQVKEIAKNLGPDINAKFLRYPIPKKIIEQWKNISK